MQQKQIDVLEHSMTEAIRKLEGMVLALEENGWNPGMEVPPHYQPKRGF